MAREWASIGTEYIYHIQVDNKIYIGQSKAAKPGSRLEYRLKNPFSMTTDEDGNTIWSDKYDVPELGEIIRKIGLKNVQVRYFTPPLFGVSQELMSDFQKTFKIDTKGKETISALNAAEILHILYYTRQGYKLFNISMGGTDGTISVVQGDKIVKKVFTKTMTPQEASQLFFSNITTLESLTNLVQHFNKIVFTDEWKNFYNQTLARHGKNTKWGAMTYAELVKEIQTTYAAQLIDLKKRSSLLKSIRQMIEKWGVSKISAFYSYLEDFLTDEDISLSTKELNFLDIRAKEFDEFYEYVTEGIVNQLTSESFLKKIFKDEFKIKRITTEFKGEWKKFKKDKNVVKTNLAHLRNTFNIINIGTLFNLKHLTKNPEPWWGSFNHWAPQNPNWIPERWKKEIAFSVFSRIYNKTADENFYDKKKITAYKYNDVYAFCHIPKGEILSVKIHEKYEEMGLRFITNQWKNFYSPMVSLLINNKDPWQMVYEEYTGRDIAYRSEVVVDTEYGMRYIGHVVKNPKYWGTISVEELEIY